ncbi:PH domain-containing protein [Weissella ceti]|uniref:PH domain-containing protein n=1 Tax=Weissella ceti TaxID=759620 RepID=UPI001BCD7E41|nr:PH domain-containing protein [Weissella ceti]QVK11650.1 PH domain-containing protein [Weissella ceti]
MILNVHNNYMKYKFWMNIVENVALLVGGIFTIWCFGLEKYMGVFVVFVVLLFGWMTIYAQAYVRNTSVTIDSEKVVIRKGRLYYREIAIPLEKVYATIKKQNILQKNVDLMTLEIQTSAKAYAVHGIATGVGEPLVEKWQDITQVISEVQS